MTRIACENCGEPVEQNEFGGWRHQMIKVTYCHTLHAETLYNNWDNRVASGVRSGGSCVCAGGEKG